MSQVLVAPQVTDAFQQNERYYVKLFLIDDSTNKNKWGIKSEYLGKHIDKFKGKPLLLTPDIWHPHEFDHYQEDPTNPQKNIEEYRRLQEPYIIGNIIEIGKNIKQGSTSLEYNALVEITNEKAIEQFKQGRLPLYVSPSIYRLNTQDADDSIGDYEPIHVAIVDAPAYGTHKANIRGQCAGTQGTCSKLLAQAGVSCVTKTLSQIKNIFNATQMNSSFSNKMDNSNVKIMVDENQNNQVSDNVTVTTTTPDGNQVVEQKQQEQVQKSENRSPINPPVSPIPEPKAINPPGSEEQREESEESEAEAKLKAKYDAKFAELESKLNKLNEFQSNLEKKAQETAALAKRTKIDSALPKDYAGSNEAREEAISKFMNIPDAELEFVLNNFVAETPCSKAVKQAGFRAPRVSDFIAEKETNNKNVKQAGTSSQDIEMLQTMLEFGGLSS